MSASPGVDLESEVESDRPLMAAAYGLATLVSLVILAVLTLTIAIPAFGGHESRRPDTKAATTLARPAYAPQFFVSRQKTVVYLVGTAEQGAGLQSALDEWQLEVEALGVADREPRRIVVVQTREDVLRQRFIDFTLLANQAPGLDLQVIDLRD
jgi:hypothetical protein